MKYLLTFFLATLAGASLAFAVNAQPGPKGQGASAGALPMDCSKVKDRTRCESLNKDIQACKHKIGDEWRECMHQPPPGAKFAPPKLRDCSKARNLERCETHNTALQSCKGAGSRSEHRKCMAAALAKG